MPSQNILYGRGRVSKYRIRVERRVRGASAQKVNEKVSQEAQGGHLAL